MMRIEEHLNEDIDNSFCLFDNPEERSLNKIKYKNLELSVSDYAVTVFGLMLCYCVHEMCD